MRREPGVQTQNLTDVTSGSRLPGGAEAPSCHRIARSLIVAVARAAAAESVGALAAHWQRGGEGMGGVKGGREGGDVLSNEAK